MQPTRRIPPSLLGLTAAIWLAGLVALVPASQQHDGAPPGSTWIALSLAALVALAGAFPLTLTAKVKLQAATVPLFAAILLFPVPIAVLIGLSGKVTYHALLRLQGRRSWFDTLLNGGRTVLEVALAGALFHALAAAPAWPPARLTPHLVLAALLAGLASYLVNAGTAFGAVALLLKQHPLRLWWSTAPLEASTHALLLVLAFAASFLVAVSPLFTVALVCSLALAYYAVRMGTRLGHVTCSTVEALADAVDLRIYDVPGHGQRVATLAVRLAVRLGLSRDDIELVRQAARVHDIGLVGVSDSLLRQPAQLSLAERQAIERHAALGADFLARFPEYQRSRLLVRYHHERPDGGGYPDQLAGPAIPRGAAIIAVAEAYDAMTSERPYRQALSPARARAELLAGRGSAWQAEVVDALLAELDDQPSVVSRQLSAVST